MEQEIKKFILDAYINSFTNKYEFGQSKYKELLPYYELGNSAKECCLDAKEIFKISYDSGSFRNTIKRNGLIVRSSHEQNRNALARKTKLTNLKTGKVKIFDGHHKCADYLQKVLKEPSRKLVKDGMDKCFASSEKDHSRYQYRGYFAEFIGERAPKPLSAKEGIVLRMLMMNGEGRYNKELNMISRDFLNRVINKYSFTMADIIC